MLQSQGKPNEMEDTMEKAVAREILAVFGVAALAVVLLLLARFAGIAFITQTYLWTFGTLYGVRILVWALRAVRANQQASTLQHR